jgi:hypothetical protein
MVLVEKEKVSAAAKHDTDLFILPRIPIATPGV